MAKPRDLWKAGLQRMPWLSRSPTLSKQHTHCSLLPLPIVAHGKLLFSLQHLGLHVFQQSLHRSSRTANSPSLCFHCSLQNQLLYCCHFSDTFLSPMASLKICTNSLIPLGIRKRKSPHKTQPSTSMSRMLLDL